MQRHTCTDDPCPRCAFVEKTRTVAFGADATPYRRESTVQHGEWATQQFADDAAYRRLRKDGLQPPSTRGCSILERHADTREQIEGTPKLWGDREKVIAENTIPVRT